MSISSIKPPLPPGAGMPAARAKPQQAATRPSNVADTPESRVYSATKEAERQIEDAQQAATRAVREKDEEVEHAREQGDVAYEKQISVNEDRLIAERNKGYERLRELQRQNQAELSRAKREGDKMLSDTTNYYRDAVYKADREGDAKITGQHVQTQLAVETQRKVAAQELDGIRTQQRAEMERTQAESADQLSSLLGQSKDRIEKTRTNSALAETAATQKYEDAFHAHRAEHDAILSGMDAAASSQIKRIRQDTAQKLAAYSTRQEDPFYKMLDTGAQLRDNGDHYELVARIPEHEQQHVQVAVRGNNVVLSGYRKNNEELNLGPGRSRSTSAYQSYSESFPLAFPVDPKTLTKEFEGDQLIARVPKLSLLNTDPAPHAPPPRAARAERPDFPENLPGIPSSPRSNKPLA